MARVVPKLRLEGVSVEQYAGVSAALDEGLPLDAILEQEQIDEDAWSRVEPAWCVRVAEDVALSTEYGQRRREAEDCLARSIEPFDRDEAAWVALLGAIATQEDAFAFVEKLGLTMIDVGRMGRSWKRKTDKDPELGKRLAELGPTAKLPDKSKIKIGPVKLARFPWSPAPREPAPAEKPAAVAAGAASVADADVVAKRELASFQIAALEPPEASPQALPPPAPPPLKKELKSTTDVDIHKVIHAARSRGIPFSGSTSAPPPDPDPPASPRASAPPPSGGQTIDPSAPTKPTLPFDSAPIQLMQLDRYAALAAELRLSPGDAEAIMQRYGLASPESRKQIHELWRRRFETRPELREKFESIVRAATSAPATKG